MRFKADIGESEITAWQGSKIELLLAGSAYAKSNRVRWLLLIDVAREPVIR
jgi:hypothetical protein